MRRLVYRPAALADLDAIFDYIAPDNPARALSFTEALRRQCAKLAALPGTLGYIILFRYLDDNLEIVSIVEGYRNIEAMF